MRGRVTAETLLVLPQAQERDPEIYDSPHLRSAW